MKNWLKENWFRVSILVIVIIILVPVFYWYEWKPKQIREECNRKALEIVIKASNTEPESYELAYKSCLRSKGL